MESSDQGSDALRVIRHDFRNPLTSLKMLAQVFKRNLDQGTLATDRAKLERYCTMLDDQVNRLVDLSDCLFDISTLQSGQLRLELQQVDLRVILENAAATTATMDLPTSPVWGSWDPAKLTRAFHYLCLEVEELHLSLKAGDGTATVTLSGSFKPPTEQSKARIFMARELIEKHGGSLRENFVVSLPIKT